MSPPTIARSTIRIVPSTIRIQYYNDWLAAERRFAEKHPHCPILHNPIPDWSDETCAMMFRDNYIDEYLDRNPPIDTDIKPKLIKGSKRKAITRRLGSLIRSLSCM